VSVWFCTLTIYRIAVQGFGILGNLKGGGVHIYYTQLHFFLNKELKKVIILIRL